LVALDITTLKIQGLEDRAVLSWWFYFSHNQIFCFLTLEICGSVFPNFGTTYIFQQNFSMLVIAVV